MAKYAVWVNLYNTGYASALASKEEADERADYGRIECRKIEWESKEPTRVADYLVEITHPTPLYHLPFSHWLKQTHPIGQQPEGSVMIPGSERDL